MEKNTYLLKLGHGHSIHSVLERIWIKANDYHRVKGDPLRSQNHNELKSSTVGPDLPYDFWKSKNFKKLNKSSWKKKLLV